MKYVAYIRVSTDKQDSEKQRHLLLEYAQKNKFVFDEIIEVLVSSTAGAEKRRITELQEKVTRGDVVVTAELSRLSRNMLQGLTLLTELDQKGVEVVFIRQPELSTTTNLRPLLLAIYGYLAQSEREFLSLRTKQGLAAARAAGVKLGRPKGSLSGSKLDKHREEIESLLAKSVSIASIGKIMGVSWSTVKRYADSRGLIC